MCALDLHIFVSEIFLDFQMVMQRAMLPGRQLVVVGGLLLGTAAALPAFCPADSLLACKRPHGCTPGLWHGIDSLETFELQAVPGADSQIRIVSKAGQFSDTIGQVVFRDLKGNPADPAYCVRAPPAPTSKGNCTTHVEAFFSDANTTLVTATMESCGILSWVPKNGGQHLYGQWVHADMPTPSPPGAMCDWQPGFNMYKEVGDATNPEYFILENVRAGALTNQTRVKIHSVNNSFPDAVAEVREVGDGTPGKIAWEVSNLFGGESFRGIMRANSAGGPACCEVRVNPHTGIPTLKDCPVLSWWSSSGKSSCWEPVDVPSEPIGACGE